MSGPVLLAGIDVGELVTVEIELAQQRVDAAPLISGQVL